MVSPSKKPKSKAREKVGQSSKKVSAGTSQHNRTRKPLLNKKFYLDLKNHVSSSKLETHLKSLGATIELFLVQEVNVVVTDRPQWTGCASGSCSGSTPKYILPSPSFLTPSGVWSGSPVTLDSPGEGQGRRRTSRAEAMLERARLQPQQTTIDPLDNAARWGIPIWPLEKIWKWLEKVYEKTKVKGLTAFSGSNSSSPKKKKLVAPYVKIDVLQSGHRPVFKEFPLWPSFNLDVPSAGSPFTPRNTIKVENRNKTTHPGGVNCDKDVASKSTKNKPPDESRMTRTVRPRIRSEECGSAPLSGYCEICQVNYSDRKKHLQADTHIKFVSNDQNFLALDNLIKQGSNMEAFLKMNGASDFSQCSLFGNTRRSLRSVVRLSSLDASSPTTNPNSWKELLSPSKKMSLPSVSNGHHVTRSTKLLMDGRSSPNMTEQREGLEIQCNGISSPHGYGTRYGGRTPRRSSYWEEHHSLRARPQRTRTASASYCNTLELSQLSPTGSDSGHHLRSRGQMWLPSNLLGTTAEDECNLPRSRRGESPHAVDNQFQCAKVCRDTKTSNVNIASTGERSCASIVDKSDILCGVDTKVNHGNSPCISLKKKRLTVEEQLIEDNKAYYKIELKNNKLRSSSRYPSQREVDSSLPVVLKDSKLPQSDTVKDNTLAVGDGDKSKVKDTERPETPVKEENVVKRRKIRLTELSLLNNEAEHFMFGEPVRKETSDESSDDDDILHPEEEITSKQSVKGEECCMNKTFIESARNSVNKHEDLHPSKKEGSKSKENSTNSSARLPLESSSHRPSNILQCDESSMGSIDSCSLASSCDTDNTAKKKKKRRTQAEAFIHDNLDYYKFEIPGSRLRFQGSTLPHTSFTNKSTVGTETSKENYSKNKNLTSAEASSSAKKTLRNKSKETGSTDLNTGSKEANLTESHTLKNGTSSKIKNECNAEAKLSKNKEIHAEPCSSKNVNTLKDRKSDTLYSKEQQNYKEIIAGRVTEETRSCKKDVVGLHDVDTYDGSIMEGLHFSFEALPQSEPWYQTYQRQDEGEEFYLGCFSDSGYWKPFLLPYEMPPGELLNLSAGPSGLSNLGGTLNSSSFHKKKRRQSVHAFDSRPRKSPRCHASTLAILSSLMQHQKLKEPDNSRGDENYDGTLKTIPEDDDGNQSSKDNIASASTSKVPGNADFTSESDRDMREIAQNIDKMLMYSEDESRAIVANVSYKEVQGVVNPGKLTKQKTSKGKKSIKHQGPDLKVVANRLELVGMKETDIVDIDPAVLQQLALHPTEQLDCIPKPAVRCRGGPCMDVLTLLDGFSACNCMNNVSVASNDCSNCEKVNPVAPPKEYVHRKESSCNSSECGASSTCETIVSDLPDSTVKLPNKKKKRKRKNLTGWPAEKAKSKKKIPRKIDKGNENLPKNKMSDERGLSEKLGNALIDGNSVLEVGVKRTSKSLIKESASETQRKLPNDSKNCNKGDKSRVGGDGSSVGGKLSVGTGDLNLETFSRDEVLGKISEGNVVDRHSSKELSITNMRSPAERFKTSKSFLRTLSLDANPSDLQPCVRVKKIDNITDLNFLSSLSSETSGVINNRRLRSASSSSFPSSSPIRKRHSLDADLRSNSSPARRESSRIKKLEGIWDAWSTRRRR
ncbi:uncharacterized protein [Anabrus simplex]|uniref:uncharacterized protein isoform X2 n=1 Tax=Anabrus simplex TaxID=316456 RepID=UPI0035A27C9A